MDQKTLQKLTRGCKHVGTKAYAKEIAGWLENYGHMVLHYKSAPNIMCFNCYRYKGVFRVLRRIYGH